MANWTGALGLLSMPKVKGSGSVGIDERCERTAGFYFARRHGLIHRHTETLSLNSDESADWRLRVEFELPTDPAARCSRVGDRWQFLFPLMFLRKAEGRTGFYVRDESGGSVALLTRAQCNSISATAAAEAAKRLLPQGQSKLPPADLKGVFASLCATYPYDASVILNELCNVVEPRVLKAWEDGGLFEDLSTLMEHSVVWLPITGLPGERRVVEVGKEIELTRRSIVRWRVGELEEPKHPRLRPWRSRMLKDPRAVLNTGKVTYGRLGRRISFPALAERMVRPLAWIPIQCDIPTIYTRRCDSYHFELLCPDGLSPRDVRLGAADGDLKLEGNRTLGSRAAHLYLPGSRAVGDLSVRATVGVGAGSFPILWFIAGALTAAMLWVLAAADPSLLRSTPRNTGQNEILASVLLGAPAVLAALVVVGEGGIARMLGGARVLLFVPALCSVFAATVLVGTKPLGEPAQATWTVCAGVATAATIPLVTSWLISSPIVWHQLMKLNTTRLQYAVTIALGWFAALLVWRLGADTPDAERASIAVLLLALAVPLLLVATNRAAVPIEKVRRYVAVGAGLTALICVGAGCVELRAAFDVSAGLHLRLEPFVVAALILSPFAGFLLEAATRGLGPSPGVIHIPPEDGRNLIARKSITYLAELRGRTQQGSAAPAA